MDNSDPSIGLSIRGLYKVFGKNPRAQIDLVRAGVGKTELMERHAHVLALRDINIEMPCGCIQVIMGLSGSGKSTLVRHINRLIDPTVGDVIAGGRNVTTMGRADLLSFRQNQTAMVFQKFALLPHYTVLENAAYGLKVKGVTRTKRLAAAAAWIDRVSLKGFEHRYPHQLSGGMQQRVGLARALTNNAPILLMDEAFSALDPLIRYDMQTMLLDLQKDVRKTIVFITHDLDEALRLGNRIAVLRDGEVIQQGTGEDIVLNPADDYIASFVRNVNRGKVLRVEKIMQLLGQAISDGGLAMAADTLLEDAARLLSQSDARMAVILDAQEQACGQLALDTVMKGMLGPSNLATGASTQPPFSTV